MCRIVLASASPRRKELLRQLIGDNFEICVSSYDEAPQSGLDATELVLHHSLFKARDVVGKYDSGIIISADTVVLCEGQVLGKPHSPEKAKEMLDSVSGKIVQAITGMTVLNIDLETEVTVSEITDVKMKKMSVEEIASYVRSGEPMDKAGAFAIQGKGAILVESIMGDFFNVVGLPLFKLGQILEDMGVHIFEIE
ncbi:Maf family nucleotide pyrophosphatase [Methanococcoides sp. LMO-2]|uniref:dTTP/UTP pyrophosphatase n=1 Tax=Methanococcoides cohabitans TaxID=3136559 RepID=A0ABU9KTM7_9EURY